MKISAVQANQVFGASIKKTEQGNEYRSTNVAKVVFPAVSVAAVLMDVVGGVKLKAPKIIFNLAISTGIGFLIDHFVDKTRQADVDDFAETGEVKDKTHKGLGIGAAVGAGWTFVSEFMRHSELPISSKIKSAALIGLPLGAIGGLCDGALFYDLRVNKTRKELMQKAEMQNQIQQAVNDYKVSEESKQIQ